MEISASALRQNIYKTLDSVLETGNPVEINRKGKKLRIIPVIEENEKLKNLKSRDIFTTAPENLININTAKEWKI